MSAVRVCGADELLPGIVRTAFVGHDLQGLPIVAMVLRDPAGKVRVYRNLCRHLAVPLDGGTGDLLTDDGQHLVCGTHGATYRVRDGYCIEGPCKGLALHALTWQQRDGDIYVLVADG